MQIRKYYKSKLIAAGKKSLRPALQKWAKSIINHFWWACATSEGSEQLLREKWVSVLFHVQNNYSWTNCDLFSKCKHLESTKKQIKSMEWLSENSDAFMVLQDIVTLKTILNDLKHLTQFSHTETLEIYHELYNKWAPKSKHFSYLHMVMRNQLAVLYFNSGSGLEQARTKSEVKKYNVGFSKISKTWSSNPIKAKKVNYNCMFLSCHVRVSE